MLKCMQKCNFKVKNFAQIFAQKAEVMLLLMEDVFLNYSKVFDRDYNLQL